MKTLAPRAEKSRSDGDSLVSHLEVLQIYGPASQDPVDLAEETQGTVSPHGFA